MNNFYLTWHVTIFYLTRQPGINWPPASGEDVKIVGVGFVAATEDKKIQCRNVNFNIKRESIEAKTTKRIIKFHQDKVSNKKL